MVRIAACISGCLRNWRYCIPQWRDTFFRALLSRFFVEEVEFSVDYFVHTWNYNWIFSHKAGYGKFFDVSSEEIQEYRDFLNPVKMVVQTKEDQDLHCHELDPYTKWAWQGGQLWGVQSVAKLKKSYEIENGFQYDLCVRMRNDLIFPGIGVLDSSVKRLPLIAEAVYGGCDIWNYGGDEWVDLLRVGVPDWFFFSKSEIFDTLCSTYNLLLEAKFNDELKKYVNSPERNTEQMVVYNAFRVGGFPIFLQGPYIFNEQVSRNYEGCEWESFYLGQENKKSVKIV